jgi:hypothetical protein
VRKRDLPHFNAPTPREVPLSVGLRILFGGLRNQFGWILLGFGMVFVWIFALNADLTSPFLFRLETATTRGRVESIHGTNASSNDRPIFEVRYTYFDNYGRPQAASCYATGGHPEVGDQVTVEYVSAFPEISRLPGMRRRTFGALAAFPVLFPLVGLGLLLSGAKHGLKALRLLREGKIAFGTLISTESTRARINDRPVLKLTYAFKGEGAYEWQVTARTHNPEALRDEAEEPVLYDPADPTTAVLLDELPGPIEFDRSGRIVPGTLLETAKVLLVPSLTVIGHGTYVLLSLS